MLDTVRTIHKNFNKINLVYEKKKLNSQVSLHFHDFYELEIVTNGGGYTFLNGKRFTIKKGAVIFSTPKDFHDYVLEEETTFINVQFSYDAITETPPYFVEPIAYLTEVDYITTVEALELIGKLDTSKSNQRALAEKVLQGVLALITPRFKSQAQTVSAPSSIEKATAYIHAKFKDNPSLEEVASVVYFNKRYFCKLFKNYTGKTYKQYLREVKLKHALNLLKCANLSITNVATESGYSSISHFNREFYAYYKKTPTQVKKEAVK